MVLIGSFREKDNVVKRNNQGKIKKLEVTAATSNPNFSRLISVIIIFNFIRYKVIG